eukprot:3015045-Rhodomonas_salina.1
MVEPYKPQTEQAQVQCFSPLRKPAGLENTADVHHLVVSRRSDPQHGKEEPDPCPPQIRVLFIGANNSDAAKLKLEEERNLLEKAFRLKMFESAADSQLGQAQPVEPVFQHQFFADAQTLMILILDHRPTVLHFGCHGDKSGLRLFQSAAENSLLVEKIGIIQKSYAGRESGKKIRLAIVNACMSKDLAEDLSSCIDFVIGYEGRLPDSKVAIPFTTSFYE